jgi:transcriptional regulator NrdR family protein
MECKFCNASVDDNDLITAVISAHDENLIDLIVECPECHKKLNTFIDMREMRAMDA